MRFGRWIVPALALVIPFSAEAHRVWLLPSATIFSATDQWVTVDAASSNELFFFDHNPLRLANVDTTGKGHRRGRPADLSIIAPDGSQVAARNAAVGRYRSTFDVHLAQEGTYRIAALNNMLVASYKVGGERKRWRGDLADAPPIPSGATDVRLSHNQARIETFVTVGKPSTKALTIIGKGLEMVPVTPPADLVAGQAGKFRFVLDGKPVADLKVVLIAGNYRYKNGPKDISSTTDANGEVALMAPAAGFYWMQASARGLDSDVKGAKRRASYAVTLEFAPAE